MKDIKSQKLNLLTIILVFTVTFFPFLSFAAAPSSGVYFENLKSGETVTSPLTVKMGVSGKKVGPAGEIIDGVGHHHIIINGAPTPEGDTIPADEKHIHYGKGQTESVITLPPGTHNLTLQFANGAHQSYGKEWSKTITVIVRG